MTLIEKSLNGTPYWELSRADLQPDAPIVLGLHYMTGDHTALAFIFEDFPKPIRAIFLEACCPSGDELGGLSWYPDEGAFYSRTEAEQAPDIRTVADEIAAFLGAFKVQYPTSTKTAVIGMSQGGDLSLSLVAYHPTLIDLAIPCAGRLPAPMRPEVALKTTLPKVCLKHGMDDEIVPVEAAREADRWLKSAGYEVTLQEYPGVKHELPPEVVSDLRAHLLTL